MPLDLSAPLLASLGCALKGLQVLQSEVPREPALSLAACHEGPRAQEAHLGVLGTFWLAGLSSLVGSCWISESQLRCLSCKPQGQAVPCCSLCPGGWVSDRHSILTK